MQQHATSSPKVTEYLAQRNIKTTTLDLPENNKRALHQVFKNNNKIDFVFNLSQLRALTTTDENYIARRLAVDFGIPLVNDSKCARLFVEAVKRKRQESGSHIGEHPSEVKSWSEFVGIRC